MYARAKTQNYSLIPAGSGFVFALALFAGMNDPVATRWLEERGQAGFDYCGLMKSAVRVRGRVRIGTKPTFSLMGLICAHFPPATNF